MKTTSLPLLKGLCTNETFPRSILQCLLRGVLLHYLFVLELDYVMWKTLEGIKNELGFILEKQKSRGVSPKVLTNQQMWSYYFETF